MTVDIALVLAIVGLAVILFVTERLRVDLVALLVLTALALTNLVTPAEALSGFSNGAVVTVWAVFILSGALTQTGVADIIGRQLMRLAGGGMVRLMALIMVTAAVLSAFMNNVGVAALLLPVVLHLARRSGHPPSQLLMPLAFGSLLGGLTTLIGTPPNILVSDALIEAGLEPFQLFDFTPVGLAIALAGTLFMIVIGRRLLPVRKSGTQAGQVTPIDLEEFYRLEEQLLVLRIPGESNLAGMSLQESRLGAMLGLNVVAIVHNGRTRLSPDPAAKLHAGDRLLAVGEAGQLEELRRHRVDTLERAPLTLDRIASAGIEMARVAISKGSSLVGHSLAQVNFRSQYGVNVLGVQRHGRLMRSGLASLKLNADDALLVQGTAEELQLLRQAPGLQLTEVTDGELVNRLRKRLLLVRIPEHSALAGITLAEAGLGSRFRLTVLRIVRDGETFLLPDADDYIQAGDMVLVQGLEEDIMALRGLEQLEFEETLPDVLELESDRVGIFEAILSPHTTVENRTLKDLSFRDKYGLNVLAIWRRGQIHLRELADLPVRFGDALLLYGPREKARILAAEPDFMLLDTRDQAPLRLKKAPLAVGIMAAVLVSVFMGWLPIAIAAVIGATLMVLGGCLRMEEAYRFIEWPAVFLIACMLPLGIAMDNSGAARFLADGMMNVIGDLGPLAVLAGLFLLSTLASQVMPNPAVVVLMAPVALATSADLGVSPYSMMMAIAIASSASFLSPVSHPANVLVMGPGGYRFADYIRVGLPLTVIVFLVTLLVLPLVWPF